MAIRASHAALLARRMFILVALRHAAGASFDCNDTLSSPSTQEIIQGLVDAVSTVHGWDPNEIDIINSSTVTNFLHEFNSSQVKHVYLILKRQEETFYQTLCKESSNLLLDSDSFIMSASHRYRSPSEKMKLESIWLNCDSSRFLEDEDIGCLDLLDIQPTIVGNGSHRQLKYLLTIELHFSRWKGAYNLVILQKLPKGVFADTFELQRLVDRGDFQNARVFGDRNLELPAFNSQPSIVVLCFRINMNLTEVVGSKRRLDLDIKLPLHARYPPLSQKGHELVDIDFPSFLFHFREEDDRASALHSKEYVTNSGKSIWRPAVWTKELQSLSVSLQWAIPAGNPLHASFVSGLTVTTALMGVMVLLLVASYSHKLA